MSQAKHWMFTLNNPTVESDYVIRALPYQYLIYSYEIASTGTVHIQGYVSFKSAKKLAFMTKHLPGAHFETRRGSHQQAKDYCSKTSDLTFLDGPYEFGDDSDIPQKSGARTDLVGLKADIDGGSKIDDIANNHFGAFLRFEKGIRSYMDITSKDRVFNQGEAPEILIYWGPSGTGKSHKAFTENPGAYRLNRPEKNADVLWGDYEGQEVVIVDEFYSWIPYEKLLTWVDVHPGVKVRKLFGQVKLRAKKWIFTSNKDPATWYPNIDKHAWNRRLEDWGTVVHMTERYRRPQVPVPEELNFAVEGYISEEL